MRVMPIRIVTGKGGKTQMIASFQKNWKHYLQEALGLAIFMISACFFGAILESTNSPVHHAIRNDMFRLILMGVLMGITALFIFYSPLTAPSGSQINPAVTITFLRLGRMCPWDALFFMLFQIAGGVLAVLLMQVLMGNLLTNAPVFSVITVPGKYGTTAAVLLEFVIAFGTMTMILITSGSETQKKYTRNIAAFLVCTWVILAGPISGFGMNPARSFASALAANMWTAFWIYLVMPIAGMLCAAECYLWYKKSANKRQYTKGKKEKILLKRN